MIIANALNYVSFLYVIVYNYIHDDDCDLDIQNVS